MAHGYSRVFRHQQMEHGLAHDIAAANDYRAFACNFNTGHFQHADAACRRAGQQGWFARNHLADIDGMEAIYVLGRVNAV